MRKPAILVSCLVLAACSQQTRQDDAPADMAVRDVQEPASAETVESLAPASIGPSAAPGVAFNYRYDFRMAADRIGPAQERHAQACEKLGIDRCRITGMSYRLVNDRDISAMLAFKLEPALARQFGKDGIAAVTQAEGMLIRSEISGIDEGAKIGAATRAEARLREERARIEARLKVKGIPADERARLESQLTDIARSVTASREGSDASAESLANTPMVYNYGSGEIVPGFDARSPLREAFRTAGETLIGAVAVLIVILGALIPFAVLGGIGLFAWRLLRSRWHAGSAAAEPEQRAA